MKKFFKIFGIVILTIVSIYTIFVVEESIRIANDVDAKPAIVLYKSDINKSVDNGVIYYSLGFKLVNKYGKPQVEEENIELILVSQELWLFDTFMLWGWIS